jgi:hypothetical protein
MPLSTAIVRVLDDVYKDKASTAYMAGLNLVLGEAQKRNPAIRKKHVEQYFSTQNTYTLHRETRRKFDRNRVYAAGLDSDWEIDLIDFQPLKTYNDGFAYALVMRDVLSKFLFCRLSKTKRPEEILRVFLQLLAEHGRRPANLRGDRYIMYTPVRTTQYSLHYFCTCRGNEWNYLKNWCSENNIHFYYCTSDDVKCSVIERAIRDVKTRLWKHFTLKTSFRFVEILPSIISGINGSVSRTTGFAPNTVNTSNWKVAHANLYRAGYLKPVKHKYSVGDVVRIVTHRGSFQKGYAAKYSREKFRVVKVFEFRRPSTYKLEGLEAGDDIEGVFYTPELVRTDPETPTPDPLPPPATPATRARPVKRKAPTAARGAAKRSRAVAVTRSKTTTPKRPQRVHKRPVAVPPPTKPRVTRKRKAVEPVEDLPPARKRRK